MNTLKYDDISYGKKADELYSIFKNKPFKAGLLYNYIGDENDYYYVRQKLIELGYICEMHNGMLKIEVNPIGRLNNLDCAQQHYKKIIQEAESEIVKINEVKNHIKMTTGHR